ncbi:MAG: hypothetical protein ACLFN8_04160 [Candidatus Woesearchaeota archaeon]
MSKKKPARKSNNSAQKKQVLFEDSKYFVKDKLNPHINFSRELKKGNSRKDPTEVKCTKCGVLFILPFKPRRPDVLCGSCFKSK